ncbi:hypothetical protein [Nostoc sp. CHAB 5715]|uniref:hypothetical protein n=1 Tax=Nostoc sp. CHAB 5715 TaxID=2780400 RepID=UPI001E338C54|nr:hypothetical protein [Nostoc sp. CHAB 5715]MCC5622308.1 hypothetical protein [Nostoc sp. CHAB 5715]
MKPNKPPKMLGFVPQPNLRSLRFLTEALDICPGLKVGGLLTGTLKSNRDRGDFYQERLKALSRR